MHRTKHTGDDKLYYVGAMMISKAFPITEIISFVDSLTPRIWFQTTYQKIKKWNQQGEEDDLQVASKVIMISLTCKITLGEMKTPVKGQWCDHYDCFDLENYLSFNIKS